MVAADRLVLDDHTLKDLEVFTSTSGDQSLFDFCDLSQTRGGARALKQRMAQPWSDASHIQATQDAIAFILTHRPAFTNLPSGYAIGRVEQYLRAIMPVATANNVVELSFSALAMWANHDQHYLGIVHGVHMTCKVIQALRRFVGQPELASPAGELAPLFEELQSLLMRPGLREIPDHEIGSWAIRILRLDQVFRLHEQRTMARLLQLVYELDALLAMADTTHDNGFVLPHIEEGALRVRAQGLVHPFVSNAVANPAELDQQRRVLFLTGPNMAGKTTYLRAFANALYFAHLGMGVPASSFHFVPAQRLFSSISLSDDLRGGISYFRAEALRVKAVAQAVAAGYRVVAIMDEPFKGTNVKDALDASLAILERFSTRQDCLFLFSSHLIELQERLSVTDQIECRYFEADEGGGRLRFDYVLRRGVSSQRLGMRVLREEGVFDLLDGNCS